MLPDDAAVLTRLQVELEQTVQRYQERFDGDNAGLVMFTSGSSGTPKAAFLTWNSLMGSAAGANEVLRYEEHGVW